MIFFPTVSKSKYIFCTKIARRPQPHSQANQISNSNAAEKETLIELFKSDNIFVKHTERAKRKIEFALAQAQLQQQIQTATIGRFDVTYKNIKNHT
ncbi:MAG: hypothetical protein IKK76_03455 [Alphaproteobacteria bacterium]|nr:hypothetical protein [Alphaproteobacteria bacterium]